MVTGRDVNHFTTWLCLTGLFLFFCVPAGHARGGSYRLEQSPSFILATINLQKQSDLEKMTTELKTKEALSEVAVLLVQEVQPEPSRYRTIVSALSRDLGLPHTYAPLETGIDSSWPSLAILSRFPLVEVETIPLRQNDLVVRSRYRAALRTRIETPLGVLEVFNLHLDTRINPGQRAEQLAPVVERGGNMQEPVVIAGDFNTTGFVWFRHLLPLPNPGDQQKAVRDLMEAHGFETPLDGMGPTHDWLGLRLDWIFLRRLKAAEIGIEKLGFTDHHAVWARVIRE